MEGDPEGRAAQNTVTGAFLRVLQGSADVLPQTMGVSQTGNPSCKGGWLLLVWQTRYSTAGSDGSLASHGALHHEGVVPLSREQRSPDHEEQKWVLPTQN